MVGKKCNNDGMAKGIHSIYVCDGIFRNDKLEYVGSFSSHIGIGRALLAEINGILLAINFS